jgi:hypothetical protein
MKRHPVILTLLFISSLCFPQTDMLDWPSLSAMTKKGLITNVGYLQEQGVELFDFQGAIFGEYKPSRNFLLFARAIQIDKADDGSGFLYTCVAYNSRDYQSIFVIATSARVKGLNLNRSALFLCNYRETRSMTNTNKDTGVAYQIKVPIFSAWQWWYGVNLYDDSSLSASVDPPADRARDSPYLPARQRGGDKP